MSDIRGAGCNEGDIMIENAIIFSKKTGEVLLSSVYGKIDPTSDDFKSSLDKITEIAVKLEKGVFNLDLDTGQLTLIHATKSISIALVFIDVVESEELGAWEDVANEIASGFEKIYSPGNTDHQIYYEFKKTLDEIINWRLKEQSPIDKMKDALW